MASRILIRKKEFMDSSWQKGWGMASKAGSICDNWVLASQEKPILLIIIFLTKLNKQFKKIKNLNKK